MSFVAVQESIEDARTERGKLWANGDDLWQAIGKERRDHDRNMQNIFQLHDEISEIRRKDMTHKNNNPTTAILCNINITRGCQSVQHLHSALISACNHLRERHTISYEEAVAKNMILEFVSDWFMPLLQNKNKNENGDGSDGPWNVSCSCSQ